MAQFALEIADADVQRVMDAVAANYNYQTQVSNPDFDEELEENPLTNPRMIDNPENVYVFANKVVRKFLSDNVRAYEDKLAKEAAAAAVDASVAISDPQSAE